MQSSSVSHNEQLERGR